MAKFFMLLTLPMAVAPVLAEEQVTPIRAPGTTVFQAATEPVNNPVMPNYPTIVFDSETKQYDAKPGEMMAPFTFQLTNVWTNEVRIDQVKPSCGCTTAKMPATPWHIPPGGAGEVSAEVNLAGKPPGLTVKTLTFFTSVGNRIITLKVNIPPVGAATAMMTRFIWSRL